MGNLPELEREVAALGDLSREELAERWVKAYGTPPPKGINRLLMERSAAWHMQAVRFGGLSAAARAVLRAGRKKLERVRDNEARNAGSHVSINNVSLGEAPLGEFVPPNGSGSVGVSGGVDLSLGQGAASRGRRQGQRTDGVAAPLPKGTRLMREWNGRMHVVDVTKEGIIFDGKYYRSLTAVARRITGAHWSGPRFFGL